MVGLKAQDAPLGSPEQLNETAWLKPNWGLTVRVSVPELPAFTVNEAAESTMAKPGVPGLIV